MTRVGTLRSKIDRSGRWCRRFVDASGVRVGSCSLLTYGHGSGAVGGGLLGVRGSAFSKLVLLLWIPADSTVIVTDSIVAHGCCTVHSDRSLYGG